jgi:hypothetical protein
MDRAWPGDRGGAECRHARHPLQRATGRRCSERFSQWLASIRHIKDIDKFDRAKLMRCMENLGAITQRRESLSSAERLKLTHPSSVWRRWSAEFGDKAKTARNPAANPLEEVDRLTGEVARLKVELAKADNYDAFMMEEPKEIAGVYFRRNPTRTSKLFHELGRLLNPKARFA